MRTLRQQLTGKLLLGFAVPLVLGGLSVFVLTRAALLEQFDAALQAKAMAITTLAHQTPQGVEVDTTDPLMREFEALRPGRDDDREPDDVSNARAHDLHYPHAPAFFQMWRADGKPLKRSESLAGASLPCQFGTFSRPRFWKLTLPSGFPGRAIGFAFEPLPLNPDPRNPPVSGPVVPTRPQPFASSAAAGKSLAKGRDIILVVAIVRHELDEALATLALALSGCGVLLLGVTAFLVPRVLRRGFAPLDALAEQAARINADSLSTRFPTDALPGELAPIGSRLNDLLARLQRSFERERQFSADLAHELRTPIAELRSLAELALKWPEARPSETDAETLAIATQMEGIVARLLVLLRSERGQLPVARDRVALAPLVSTAWEPFKAAANGKRIEAVGDLEEGGEIETDAVLLRSILANLFDNAVEYSPPGGTIQIESEVGEDRFVVRVVNRADSLAADDLPQLFERFWRKDPARSGVEHSGLGLSLARAFARALGGDLTASLETQSRLILVLSVPTKPPANASDSGLAVTSR